MHNLGRHVYPIHPRRTLMACAIAAMLCACASKSQDCSDKAVWCAGLVTDFGSVDEGINEQAWLGLQDARSAGLLDRIERIETVDARDRTANIGTFGDAGYDLIITVGASIADETAAAAARYPNAQFIGVEQAPSITSPNLTELVFHEEKSGFLAGALAALVTQTGHVGAVCEAEFVDSIRRYCEGFREGVTYADPAVRISISYREGSTESQFQDADWGRATALAQLDDGADVLFAAGGETANAALLAGAERGALVIGTETDEYLRLEAARPQMLSSAINNVRAGVSDAVQLARRGMLPPGEYFGSVDLAPFHERAGAVSPTTSSRLMEIKAALEAGKIHLDIPYISP